MDEMIKLVQEKVGLSEDQAKAAVITVLGFVKDRLPAPLASQVDGLLSESAGGVMGQADSLASTLGGLMGRK